ncbi:MAG: DUF3883 domain-containing protein [Flavobacterium sp.]|nr:MAG: DUF3883 domain-containing protein [Flavobacterium sp.]
MEFIVNVQKLRQNIIDNPLLPIESQKLYAGLSESFKDYDNFMWKWLKEKSNGISSRGQSVLSGKDFQRIINDETFRILAKASILEPTLENYDAFSEWWYNNPHINNRPLLINRAFAGCNYESLSSTVDNRKFWKVIDILKTSYNFKFRAEPNYNWFDANVQLTEWLNVELETVLSAETGDPAKQRVWRNIFVWLIFAELNEEVLIPNVLHRRERPNGGFDLFPDRKPTFSGVVVDYEEQSRRQKDLGDAGEDLVKQYEIEYLKRIGLHEKAKSVKIVLDGEGYDVVSFDKQGNKKYIEVKTTTGEALAPFFLSENEVAFCRRNVYSYCIYRVYNYDEESNSGEFFEISNNVEDKILMQPTQYRVLLKKPAN